MAKQITIGCGLVNSRRNCFFNASLQALFYTPKIAYCIQNEVKGNKCAVRNCITCGMLDLFALTKSSKVACSPYQLYDRLKKTNQRFTDLLNGQHQDAHEFLMVFNQELERPPHSARWFTNNFSMELATIITCNSCGRIHESTSPVTDLALHLEGNKSIQAAVDSYFNYDDIDFLCEECRTYDTVKKKHHIVSAPPCLCVHLRRFSDHGAKITDTIEISGISLKKHFLSTRASECNYKLVAVVNHFGQSRNVGHYNTIILTPNGEHYEFDDRSVRKVSSSLVSGENAYILFYTQIEESRNYTEESLSTSNDNLMDEQCPSAEGCLSTEVDEKCESETNRLNGHIQNIPGRRIVNVDYMFKQLSQLSKFTCKLCESGNLIYTNEVRGGLLSSFKFICENCGNSLKIDSCPAYDDTGNINTSAVLGTISVGLGYYHLQEFLAHLDVPAMSYVTYHKYEEEQIQSQYWKLSKQLEAEALAEEIRLAKEMNEVDSAGNALIPVEFDGSWEKRSYTTNFSSLGGCAAIIGLRTKKILYSRTKQKYCHICKIAASRCAPPRNHVCKRNYDGPSSGMETQIIIEGYKFCAEKGARFNQFVGDGDSSTYKALRDLQIYHDPYITIEKFECVNHLFRNFFKQFKALLKSSKVSVKGRNLLSIETGRNLCKGIRLAAQHWRESNVELAEKYRNLENDIMNAFQHYLGVHDDCASYFCQKTTNPDAAITISILKETGVYYEVMDLCQYYFGNNVKSLVAGLCTNKTEGFNSLIAKTIGGKRICNSLAGSYQLRTNMAGVQYNTGGHSGSKFREFIFDKSTPIIKKMENERKRKCVKNAIAKEEKPKIFANDEPAAKKKKRKYYADGHEDLDMADAKYAVSRARFLQRLRENQMNWSNIEIETRGQPHSFRWMEVRKLLLTSSYFGRILKVRSRRSYTNIVEEILYKNIQYSNTSDMRHQRIYEKEGLRIFVEVYPFDTISPCGIFIDRNLSFLGATPLRLYGNDAIVIVKCPKKEFGKAMRDAIKTIPFWSGDHTNRSINKKSHWFFEIQGQLHITQRKMACLVIYLGNKVYEIVEIERDDAFWLTEMENQLSYFYNEALLKELIDSRDGRSMELRQYNSA